MQFRPTAPKTGRASDWPRERLEQLGKEAIEQLRANAERLGEADLAVLCATVLKERRKTATPRNAAGLPRSNARKLVSRGKAFEMRGIWLSDERTSWSGVRKVDGGVVFALWAGSVTQLATSCECLLWAPNVESSSPWSDTPAGAERLAHCKLALQKASAEGLLVYGEALDGFLPQERARTIQGVDWESALRFSVEKRGEEYWAVWGTKVKRAKPPRAPLPDTDSAPS
jgi:hypothetical protein